MRCQDIDPDKRYHTLNCLLAGAIRKRISPGMYVLVQNWGDLTSKPKGTISDFYTDSEVEVLVSHGLWDYDDSEDKSNIVGIEFESNASISAKKQSVINAEITDAKKKTSERDDVSHFTNDIDGI